MVDEKRKEVRLTQQIEFYVFVDECQQNPRLVGEAFDCEASDISSQGLKIHCRENLYKDNRLNITIGAGDPFVLYALKGNVRWCKEEDGLIVAGVQIVNDPSSDFKIWSGSFEEIFLAEEEPEDELDAFLREIDD